MYSFIQQIYIEIYIFIQEMYPASERGRLLRFCPYRVDLLVHGHTPDDSVWRKWNGVRCLWVMQFRWGHQGRLPWVEHIGLRAENEEKKSDHDQRENIPERRWAEELKLELGWCVQETGKPSGLPQQGWKRGAWSELMGGKQKADPGETSARVSATSGSNPGPRPC